MRTCVAPALVVVTAAAVVTAFSDRRTASGWNLTIRPVPSPAAAESGQPQLSVSDRGVLLSWIERTGGTTRLRFAERTTAGWSAPVTVASGADWFVNWADVPSVLRMADGTLAAHWLQKSGVGTYAYDVKLSFSRDGGKTWSAAFTPHHDGTKTEHGFVSLWQMPGKNAGLGLAWLDGRAMAGAGHDGHGGGEMSLRFTTYDRQWKQAADAVIDGRVCECCPTSAAMTSEGPIVAFRNRTAGEVRDIQVSRLERGSWTEPVSVHEDGWRIPGCPVNGPALSARGTNVAVAWFSARDDQPRAYVALSRDAGRTFAAPVRLDTLTSLGRVDVELLPDGSAVASYVEFAGWGPRFNVRRVDPAGARSEAITISTVENGRASGYPRMALHDNELVFAWLEGSPTTSVKTAVATLPR